MIDKQYVESRKIQFSGRSSYVLALPKKWVEEMGLRQGDQVILQKQNNTTLNIIVEGTHLKRNQEEVTIIESVKQPVGSIRRKLISLYLLGYNIIHIRSKEGQLSLAHRESIKDVVRRNLIGTEILFDSSQETTIQVLLGFPELSVENALRRMFTISTSMHKDALLALLKHDQEIAQGVIKSDDEVDRFGLYTIRQLKMAVSSDLILDRIGLNSPRDCLGYRLIVKSVERVADHACRIAQTTISSKNLTHPEILKKIAELSDYAISVFEDACKSLFKRDYHSADIVVEKADQINSLEKEIIEKIETIPKLKEMQVYRLIIDAIKRTSEYASDIAEIVLNLNA